MLLKLLLHDFVRDTKPEDMGRIIEEGCGVILTRDQQGKIATKRAELQGDPNSKVVGKVMLYACTQACLCIPTFI